MKVKHNALWTMAIACVLSACSPQSSQSHSSSQSNNPPRSASAVASEANANLPTYDVITDAAYPPFDLIDGRGHVIGFEMDLLDAIAADQHFKVNYRLQSWDGMFDELKNNQAHIISNAIVISDDEDSVALLTQSYMQSNDCLVARNPEHLNNWQTRRIAVAENEDYHETLQERFYVQEKHFVRTATPYLGVKALVNGEADMVASDCSVLTYYTSSPTFANFQFHQKVLPSLASAEDISLVFAVNKQHPELVEKINKGLDNVKKNGQYDQILSKWRLKAS